MGHLAAADREVIQTTSVSVFFLVASIIARGGGGRLVSVRAQDIEVGLTYQVAVPTRLAPGEDRWLPMLWLLRGMRFALTVTRVDGAAPTAEVEGLRVVEVSTVTVELTGVQAADLGLPAGNYRISGRIQTADGAPVMLPNINCVRVPARWVHPSDEDLDAEESPLLGL